LPFKALAPKATNCTATKIELLPYEICGCNRLAGAGADIPPSRCVNPFFSLPTGYLPAYDLLRRCPNFGVCNTGISIKVYVSHTQRPATPMGKRIVAHAANGHVRDGNAPSIYGNYFFNVAALLLPHAQRANEPNNARAKANGHNGLMLKGVLEVFKGAEEIGWRGADDVNVDERGERSHKSIRQSRIMKSRTQQNGQSLPVSAFVGL